MTNLLHIDSSITGAGSVSRILSAAVVARAQALISDLSVTRRDLAAEPLTPFSDSYLAGRAGLASDSARERPAPTEEDRALDELLACDVLVLGAPMYNLAVPTQLKTWIDHITVAGKTFRYTPNGSVGLLDGKKLVLASSRGGIYSEESGRAGLDHQESYLRAVFAFLGIVEVTVIRAEGVRISPELAETALADALAAASGLTRNAFA